MLNFKRSVAQRLKNLFENNVFEAARELTSLERMKISINAETNVYVSYPIKAFSLGLYNDKCTFV
jgi:hypothetical protein